MPEAFVSYEDYLAAEETSELKFLPVTFTAREGASKALPSPDEHPATGPDRDSLRAVPA